ncbi:hypothetical protein H0A36_28320 [Endozoicomonas sp. SM1973]|uniref:Uncharacterized protein n=1 Tax=Spartinivicinus marinus TaxID=2994442 RepID=A0A853IIR5_9GAMM|nr:hypothetical protein [Spartinivicinus marinus]MCX4024768.1 hypothetical protein [Spartinivicinus marinus]NYZ69924.1 hypothetical protein [Spartinivicinus marinus]
MDIPPVFRATEEEMKHFAHVHLLNHLGYSMRLLETLPVGGPLTTEDTPTELTLVVADLLKFHSYIPSNVYKEIPKYAYAVRNFRRALSDNKKEIEEAFQKVLDTAKSVKNLILDELIAIAKKQYEK